MKKIFDFLSKSKYGILSFAFMLMIGGYINYQYNPDREKNLGQTVYVNGKDTSNIINTEVKIYDDKKVNNNFIYEKENKNESAISVFKEDRDRMFSELNENYISVIKNNNSSIDNVESYQKKLEGLISKKNLINMVENIIKSETINLKNVRDVVIIPLNNDKLNVIIDCDGEISKSQIAKIQELLTEQFDIDGKKISIRKL